MYTEQSVQRIKDAANVYDVVSRFVKLTKKGANYVGCCPFHNERTPSFTVTPSKNMWKCFGCGKGGDAISFLEEHEKLDYPGALDWIAREFHVHVEFVKSEKTEQEIAEQKKREALSVVLQFSQEYFVEQLFADNPDARSALQYAIDRWGEDTVKKAQLGYCPKGQTFLEVATKRGFTADVLQQAGLIADSSYGSGKYVCFGGRLTIPIKSTSNKVIGYTARYLGNKEGVGKYTNPTETPLYKKSDSLFGINVAAYAARDAKYFLIVEGAPDVLRLQSLGFSQAVAPLGTALTVGQLKLMKRYYPVIRFVPDGDAPKDNPYGAGIEAVMKNGKFAMQNGFEVSVREIPPQYEQAKDENGVPKVDENGKAVMVQVKADPDSYFTDRQKYLELDDVPFVVWYARKKFPNADSQNLKNEVMQEIAGLLILMQDELTREMCIDQLSKIYGKTKMWRDSMRRAGKLLREQEYAVENDSPVTKQDFQLLRSLGIIIKDGCYCSPDKDGNLVRWSNFILVPKIHIKDVNNAVRIFSIVNDNGDEDSLELVSEDFVSLPRFQKKLISLGNYVWRAKQDQLITLQQYLFAISETAEKVEYMGWNSRHEYYAMANGLFIGGSFVEADPLGIVRHGGKTFFLPPYSSLNQDDQGKYSFERQFFFDQNNGLTFKSFASKIVEVYGDGGKIGIAWALAALFRDHIFSVKKWFPIFNIFGKKGTGKTNLAMALASMCMLNGKQPPSLTNTSIPAMSYMLSRAVNGILILDEYTNEIGVFRIDFLKGIYGGTAQTKMDMSGDSPTPISIPVHSGVIMCGQFIPLKEEAVFSRCVHIQYAQTSFSVEQKQSFNELKAMASRCNAQIVFDILRHRDRFIEGFSTMFDLTQQEVFARLEKDKVEDRILDNWVLILTAFRLLETFIDAPFSYAELFEICIKGIILQNSQIKKSSETSDFFKFIDAQHMLGRVRENCHYVIKSEKTFKAFGESESRKFGDFEKILYLNITSILPLLEQRRNDPKGNNRIDPATLEHYLKTLPFYLGRKQQRFQLLRPNGEPDVEFRNVGGQQKKYVNQIRPYAFCFLYSPMKEALDLSLDAEFSDENTVELVEEDEPDEQPMPVKPPSLFPSPDDRDMPF